MDGFSKLSKMEKDILEDNHMYRFDMKQVTKLKFQLEPQDSYLEELFLPRHSSKMKYLINPLLFVGCAASFGISKSIYRDLPKLTTSLKYAKYGLALSVPYLLVNEVATGMLIRGYGQEQFFYSNTIAAAVCFFGMLAISLPKASKCKTKIYINKKINHFYSRRN